MAIKSKKKVVKGKKTIVPQDNKRKTIVKDFINNNKERMEIDESHMPFASRFLFSLFKEQDEIKADSSLDDVPVADEPKNPKDFTPEGDKEVFDKSLEPTTDPNEFETQGVSPEFTSDTINSIREWSDKLGEFANFLNDPSTESLHKILADGDRAGSLLRGVTRKASDSITRIAGEVEKLKEILNTYIITAPKKLRDTEQLKAGS